MKAILERPAKITQKTNWERKNGGTDGEFIRKKKVLSFIWIVLREGKQVAISKW